MAFRPRVRRGEQAERLKNIDVMRDAMSNDWCDLRRCNWLHEALFLKSVLDAAGIDALVPDEHTLGVQPLYGVALGGVRLLVRCEDLERASELLDSEAGGSNLSEVGEDA